MKEAGKTALVLDDDKPTVLVIKQYLMQLGYPNCITATNIEEAKALFIANQHKISLITTDYNLANGVTSEPFITHVRHSNHPNIPIILITGQSSKQELDDVFTRGRRASVSKNTHSEASFATIAKPINKTKLEAALQGLFDKKVQAPSLENESTEEALPVTRQFATEELRNSPTKRKSSTQGNDDHIRKSPNRHQREQLSARAL